MKKFFSRSQFIVLLLFFVGGNINAQLDSSHYSKASKTYKPYRIFLPAGYDTSQKRYPVIYFLHGNFGSHEFKLDGVDQLINDHDVILVSLTGRPIPSEIRPYNIGDHSDIKYSVQFKDYFLDLINHIDKTYRTVADRSHRAAVGHSMGGFMSFVLSGEYPQLLGTAVDLKGAPEFFVGYPDNHTLYSLRHMFKNHHGVRLRLHNSTVDQLVNLNNEVNQGAARENGLDYTYAIYPGGHDYTANEFKDAFNFIIASFKDPIPMPSRWHHADIYPEFEVWGYEVKSNLQEPGFIELEGVTKGGLGIRTRKWQPDGKLIPGVQIDIKTAPAYKPSTTYTLFDFNKTQNTKNVSSIRSDVEGRINFSVNHESHQIGIYKKNDPPDIVFIEYNADGKGVFLDHNKECNLNLRVLNRGGSPGRKIKVKLSSSTEGVTITNSTLELDNIQSGELLWLPSDFKVTAANKPTTDGSPFPIRFNLIITDDKGKTWEDEFDCMVFYDVPVFSKIGIDDWDSDIFGHGNGNNIAEPGETFMVYQSSHRTRLYYDDPYVDDERLHVDLHPDTWGGDGFSLSSLIHISKDCPIGHQIKFLACYEEKEWKTIKRNVIWGTFSITVGKE